MLKANFDEEKKLLEYGYDFVIGIDEAGRGPLAGPVVAAAVALKDSDLPEGSTFGERRSNLPDAELWDLVRDSKTLSEKQRGKMFDFIQEHFFVGVGICDHRTIDRINILEATFLAMKKAVTNLVSSIKYDVSSIAVQNDNNASEQKNKKYMISDTKYIILVDGNKQIPNFSMEQKAIIGGDRLVKSIAAASIIAKVTRDRMMLEMDLKYPQYGFAKHKGYGTKLHTDAIAQHGPCEIHRRSFEPIRSLIDKK